MTDRATIIVAQPIDPVAMADLRRRWTVINHAWWRDEIGSADALIVRNAPVDADLLSRARRLRVIARIGVGTDSIDVQAATGRGIAVAITPDGNSQAVAEHVFALILALLRRVTVGDRAVRDGRFQDREHLLGHTLAGRTLGIVGYGRIGRAVARIAQGGFGLQVAVLARRPSEVADTGVVLAESLDALLAASDIVSLHVPLTSQTAGMINANALTQMRDGAYLINTARAALVDHSALIAALDSGRLAGAGIDVFDGPPAAGNPLLGRDDVVLTPHVAAMTKEAFASMSRQAVEAIGDTLGGRVPANIVNPTAVQARSSVS